MSRPMRDSDLAEIGQPRPLTASGYLVQVVRSRSPRDDRSRWWRVRWQPYRPQCCGLVMVGWGDAAPIQHFDPKNDGGIRPDWEFCWQCGARLPARCSVKELEPTIEMEDAANAVLEGARR